MAASSSPPSAVQIREANAHLAALHQRVTELERRLAAAEDTVRSQAESLIRKDAEMRQAASRLQEGKAREIAALEEKLKSSDTNARKLLNVIQEKDDLIGTLRHRSCLLSKICRSRPVLDNLLAYIAEGERLNSPEHHPSPDANCLLEPDFYVNDFSLDDDSDVLFGTTV